jgi:superfamily I DNA/RNA helicase
MQDQQDGAIRYKTARDERDERVRRVLTSKSKKKVVVAGPGTGKTYLFKRALDGKKRSLTLTFVNALVEDLSLDLYGMSDVRTLHSFARSLLTRLWKKEAINVFPKLSDLIREDLRRLSGQDIDFDKIFHTMDVGNQHIEFYKRRKKYYDNSYGYSDVVFAAVQFLKTNPDKIPTYEQIVVDEFQDFNDLEVALIDLLSERSPVLLVGDDDQALYDFKSADAKHIRERHNANGAGYEAFNLPLCSRCTRVVVGAANDIVEAAIRQKLLGGRIAKPFKYFDDEDKDAVSARHPTITYRHLFASQFAWYVETKLDEAAASIRDEFSVLIITPTKVQARSVSDALRKRGFKSVEFVDRSGKDLTLMNGLKILLESEESNLGWRIVAGFLMNEADFKSVLERSDQKCTPPLRSLIPVETQKAVKKMLTLLRKVRDEKPVDEDGLSLLKQIGLEPYRLGLEALRDDLNSSSHGAISPGLRKLPITVTTIQGSKGLSADVVFVTYFDDAFFVKKDGMTDRDVCNFLVALTRAEKKVFLVSSQNKQPTFLKWIDESRITME